LIKNTEIVLISTVLITNYIWNTHSIYISAANLIYFLMSEIEHKNY